MEYVDGPDLAKLVKEKRHQNRSFLLGDAVRIMLEVIEALRVIHGKRVYHGDLKPGNVLIRREDGGVKVTDFSLSRFVGPSGHVSGRRVTGTPMYMAPEVWEGKPTLQSDIFALGAMFYEMLIGASPFAGASKEAIRGQILRGELREFPSTIRKDLPFEVERIILRCLETPPADRYATVEQLAEDLRATDVGGDRVARLADCITDYSTKDDRAFLAEDLARKGYRGDGLRPLVLEFCLEEDPKTVLTSCFSKAGLARLARGLGIDLGEAFAAPEQYAQAILQRLGLGTGGAPQGIESSIRALHDLEHRIGLTRDFDEVAAIVARAAREYEHVLRDLVRFYGQVLYGRFYERALFRLARKRLSESKRALSRVSLGDLVAILVSLNEHLEGDAAEVRHFRKVFGRSFAVPPELLANSKIIAVRNQFAHHHEELARSGLHRVVVEVVRPMLGETLEFLRRIEADRIYPQIVVVESFVMDRFGRKYIYCRNDQGRLQKVFTNVTIDTSRHYFFYPTSNPTSIYPIILPT